MRYGCFCAVCECLPLIEAVGEDEAVARAEAVAEHRLFVRRFEPRVVLRADARVLPVFADEAPLRELDPSGACVRMMGRSCDGAAL